MLLIDNYDSFTHNLYQQVLGLGAAVVVRRNDAIDLAGIAAMDPTHVIIGPGPGHPARAADFGVCTALIQSPAHQHRPLLGVCLGHQGIALLHGGQVVRAPRVMHGKTSHITHDGRGLFADLPQGFTAMRYHSLMVDPGCVPAAFEITARSEDGVIQGLRHRSRPVFGVQFHPESIGTPLGAVLMGTFLEVG